MGRNDFTSYSTTLKAKAAKAALLNFGTGEVWVPLSVLSEDSRDEVEKAERNDDIDVEVAEWFADKEGLND